MNTSKKLALAATLVASVSVSSQAVELKAADSSVYTQLCMTAASGNRAALHNSIKATGYSTQFINKSVQCNTKDMISFISQYGKNVEAITQVLDRRRTHVSITDLAMIARKYK